MTGCGVHFSYPSTGPADLAHGKGTPARIRLLVDGRVVGEGNLPVTIPLDIGITEGLACGRDPGSTVTDRYSGPVTFTGALEQVVVDVAGAVIEDKDAELRRHMAHQ